MLKNQIQNLENLNLTVSEIEELLDAVSITDELVDYIAKRYHDQLKEEKFLRIKDLLNLNDLTKFDENVIDKSLTKAAKRSFCSLMLTNRLSKSEIVFFLKNNLVTDKDLNIVLKENPTKDFIYSLLCWKPKLLLDIKLSDYGITEKMFTKYNRRLLNLEKFVYISDESQ
jgi:DNA-binding transcriptional MerR regulator